MLSLSMRQITAILNIGQIGHDNQNVLRKLMPSRTEEKQAKTFEDLWDALGNFCGGDVVFCYYV